MIISATSLRSVGSGSASARWVLRVVVSVAARIDPSTANPTVEPSARCALMMPDAIPARWVGTAVIASEVIGVRHNPAPAPTKTRPALTTTVLPCSPTIRTANPTICDAMPRRISRREPTAPTSLPAVSETIIRLMLYGKRRNPASVGEKPRTFCMYCVITSNIPYTANKAAKIDDDRERVRAVAEELEVHHRVRVPPFAEDKCRQRRPRDYEQRQDLRRKPARTRTFNHCKRESPDRRHKYKLPGDVERARAFVPRLRHKAPC